MEKPATTTATLEQMVYIDIGGVIGAEGPEKNNGGPKKRRKGKEK
jgi:hypothetical protein